MQGSKLSPTVTPELRLGSRPSATPLLRFALTDIPEPERVVRFCEYFENIGVKYDAERIDEVPIEIDLTLQALPGIQLLSGRMQGGRWRRICGDPTDDVSLIVNLRGQHLVAQDGREVVLGDGEATLVSLTAPMVTMPRPPGDFLVLRVPGPLLVPRLAAGHDGFLRRVPQGTPALSLLINYMNVAWPEHGFADPDLQQALVSHLHDLMAVAIGATRDAAETAQGRGLPAARLRAIKLDIERYLDQPDLSVSALAARHRCTPRSVQRLFEMEGTTFTEYVLTQRLARVRARLLDQRFDSEKISSIAYDCGFSDVSYFNRMFRRSFGAAPTDIRAERR